MGSWFFVCVVVVGVVGVSCIFIDGKFFSVAFGVFSFFRGPLEGVVGVLAVRSPVPGRGVVWESVEPGVEKITKNRKFSIFFKSSKKSQNAF